MDIGDTVIYAGKRFYLRGLDPVGVAPRLVYLVDANTGRTISVEFEELSAGARKSAGGLHVVKENPSER
jgi:hypothetical protein